MSPVVVRFLELVNTIREPTPPASTAPLVATGSAHAEACRTATSEHTSAPRYAGAVA